MSVGVRERGGVGGFGVAEWNATCGQVRFGPSGLLQTETKPVISSQFLPAKEVRTDDWRKKVPGVNPKLNKNSISI